MKYISDQYTLCYAVQICGYTYFVMHVWLRENIFAINHDYYLKKYYAHLNTFVQSYDIASEAINNFKKIHYMY